MRKVFITASTILTMFLTAKAQTPYCDSTLWTHVYHSYRLIVHTECMTVTGTVDEIYSEADGDYHMRLVVDTQYRYMLNSANMTSEYGDLVCEPICQASPITQSDAVQPCSGLHGSVFLPNAGEYVAVTGSYVTDNDHGWNELHPVTTIKLITAGLPNTAMALPALKVYPQPAASVVNFSFDAPPHVETYINIYNEAGKEVGAFMLAETSLFSLKTDIYPSGQYLYTISQEKGILNKGKFIIAR